MTFDPHYHGLPKAKRGKPASARKLRRLREKQARKAAKAKRRP